MKYAVFIIVAISTVAVSQFAFPSDDIAELGWWVTPLGEVVGIVVVAIAFPALPIVFTASAILMGAGLSESLSLAGAVCLGSVFATFVWTKLFDLVLGRSRSRQAND